MSKSKEWIVVNRYGGMKFIRGEFDSDKEALAFVNSLLNQDEKRKGRGARLWCSVYRLFANYSN